MAAEPHNPPEPPQVAADLPCRACGYNLRGLPTSGRCPECATDVSESISAERLRNLRKAPPDPAWARQVREGAWLSVLTFILLLAAMMAPPQWSRLPYRNAPLWEAPGRVGFLGVACTWWVVAWASMWKLTTRERFPGYPGRRGWVALVTRSLATAYLTVPILWAAMTWDGMPFGLSPADRIALLVLDLVGLFAGVGLLLRIGQLLRRRRAFVSMAEAWILALVVVAAMVYASGSGDDGPSSLTFLYSLPIYPYGIPELYINLIARPPYPSPLRAPLLWAYLALPVWSLSLVLRLLYRYRASAIAAERDAAQGAPS